MESNKILLYPLLQPLKYKLQGIVIQYKICQALSMMSIQISLVMVSPILMGLNYYVWACSMKRALISKSKFRFVDGSIVELDEFDPIYIAWRWYNNLVHSWLMYSSVPSSVWSVDPIESPTKVWRNLGGSHNEIWWGLVNCGKSCMHLSKVHFIVNGYFY